MRTVPDMKDDYDRRDVERLNAEPWQMELLDLNPAYPHWGPGEDYMKPAREDSDGHGWDGSVAVATWSAFGPWGLDDLNECVHFYFSVERASKNCETCDHTGYHPDARWISESFYRHASPFCTQTQAEVEAQHIMARFGSEERPKLDVRSVMETVKRYGPEFLAFVEEMLHLKGEGYWRDKITQDEVDALIAKGRLYDFTHEVVAGKGWQPKDPKPVVTAEMVNAWDRQRGLGHDGINQGILVDTRCKRLGVPTTCPTCEGHGYVHTAPAAHVTLTLWMLHPRKGAARGVEIRSIERTDLPAVFEWLKKAAQRNAMRFSRVLKAAKKPVTA